MPMDFIRIPTFWDRLHYDMLAKQFYDDLFCRGEFLDPTTEVINVAHDDTEKIDYHWNAMSPSEEEAAIADAMQDNSWFDACVDPTCGKSMIDPISGETIKKTCTDGCEYCDYKPDNLCIMVNPRTGIPIGEPQPLQDFEVKEIKPYHPSQDHDYPKVKENEEEPDVDVWKIDNFDDQHLPLAEHVPEPYPHSVQTMKKETRRTSSRAAELKRREEERKLRQAVSVFANGRSKKVKTYKCIRPKNSVETTPSQSDIEEWSVQPIRPTYTKVTKKKTVKGRKDHSQSERARREVLRTNFTKLSKLIPMSYLTGEKASSQISKQKILNGAKGFISALLKAKDEHDSLFNSNNGLRDKWQKMNVSRFSKYLRKQK